MSTKDCYFLSLKDDTQQTFNKKNSNKPLYSNFNLNANYNSLNAKVLQSQSISSSFNLKGTNKNGMNLENVVPLKIYVFKNSVNRSTKNLFEYFLAETIENAFQKVKLKIKNFFKRTASLSQMLDLFCNDSQLQIKTNFNTLDKKNLNFPEKLNLSVFQNEKTKKQTISTSSTKTPTNNSTLSLHIAAYENSVEASGTANNAEKDMIKTSKQKASVGKNWKNAKQFFNELKSGLSNFEIPRQQEEEDIKDPEIMNFKASQKLINPNESCGGNVLHQQQHQQLQKSSSSSNHLVPPLPQYFVQQQHQQPRYEHPQQQQHYFLPNGQMAQLQQPSQSGAMFAVDENGQSLGYMVQPLHHQSQDPTRAQLNLMASPRLYYRPPLPLRQQLSNSNQIRHQMPIQLPEYWRQRPIFIPQLSRRSSGFIPIQPAPSPKRTRKRYCPPTPVSNSYGMLNQPKKRPSLSSVFPEDSVEAMGAKFVGPQKRPIKKLAKDFIDATPHRIRMALLSNLHMEAVWALNALTAQLYDDSIQPPNLTSNLLNIIVEHFWANLSLVYPQIFAYDENLRSSLSIDDNEKEKDEESFWLKVVEDARKNGEAIKTKVELPASMKNPLGKDLNLFSREGIKIILKDAEMPAKLKEWASELNDKNDSGKKEEIMMNYEERRKLGLPTEFSLKIAESSKEFVELTSFKSDKIKFSKWDDSNAKHFEYDNDVQPKEQQIPSEIAYNDDTKKKSDDNSMNRHVPDLSLVPSHINLFLIPHSLQSFTELCLGWSNVIRGFAFNPSNQQLLVNNTCLIKIIGKLLMLYVQQNDDETNTTAKIEPNSEKAEIRSYLLNVANQLRDDAFTILSFMSGSMDLFDLDSGISYPIFDALIHWTVSKSVLSKDPLVPWGIICPRDFCLEIIAKISVIDHNIDLLLSTGPWKRIEEFVQIISDLLHMGEDTPLREFALVIMSALCNLSEAVCITAAFNTNTVENIIYYLGSVDAKVYQVVSTKGMEYRNHGDSVEIPDGMLEKAVSILESIVQHEACRKSFIKHINKLKKLATSQFMESQFITPIASIIQMLEPLAEKAKNNGEEFFHVPEIKLLDLEKQ